MIHLYDEKSALRALEKQEGVIDDICLACALPPACLKAVLMTELTEMDILDPLADAVVAINWLGAPLLMPDEGGGSPLRKLDSSTGYGQIFARVAIEAIRFAEAQGIPARRLLGLNALPSAEKPEDLEAVWHRLNRDTRFNLSCSALNLLHCAHQMTGRVAFDSYTPRELKLILTRYNADVKHVTPYGEKAYAYYLRFSVG